MNRDQRYDTIESLNISIKDLLSTKEYESTDSVNSTTVNPKKEKYKNVMMSELIIPTKENPEKIIEL